MSKEGIGCFIMVVIAAVGLFVLKVVMSGGFGNIPGATSVVDFLSGP